MEHSKLLSFAAFVICLSIFPMMAATTLQVKVKLTRRLEGGFNSTERLRLAVERGKERMHALDAFVKQRISGQLDAQTPVRITNGKGDFVMSVAVGTPAVIFEGIVDTGSDLIWTQCEPCSNCFPQSTPNIFDPSKSSSYFALSCTDPFCDALQDSKTPCNPNCTFQYTYGDGSRTIGDLAKESFSIGTGSTFPGIAVGCGHDNDEFSDCGGLVGLGRGPLSLISQLGSMVDNKFSYCLLPITDSPQQTSPLIFGDTASLTGAKTITFIKNSVIPTFWYIPVTGITLNGEAVDIPAGSFELNPSRGGGMIIDSGTTITYLVEAAYNPVKEAIMSAINAAPADASSPGFDLCYQSSSQISLPKLVFNFQGGVDYEISGGNLFIEDSGLSCLAMGASRGLSILGNVQQENFHIVYDNAQNTLSFLPTQCDSL